MKASLSALLLSTALLPSLAQQPGPSGTLTPEDPLLAAERLFTEACATCHTVPDARFAVDRAWLKQVADTA
jgi:mono/diheme cytochrome c family protein